MIGQLEKAIAETRIRFPMETILGAIINPKNMEETIVFGGCEKEEWKKLDVDFKIPILFTVRSSY